MHALQRLYCRAFQAGLSLTARCLPWRAPQRVSGSGAVRRVPALLREAGAGRPLLVTGPRLFAADIIAPVRAALAAADMPYEIFHAVESDPTDTTVEAVRAAYLAGGCDSLLAIGGGSPLDAAKAAGARLARPEKSLARMSGLLRVRRALPPLLAVPTTAGSGSETTIAAVVRDSASGRKYAISDLCLVPRWAVLDPQLLATLPAATMAACGFDALTHAVESFLCRSNTTKQSRALAAGAVRAIFASLEAACAHDEAACAVMLNASFDAGAAFTRSGVGYVHAIGHALGGLYHIPHGLAMATLLPHILADYGAAVDRRLAALARHAALCRADDNDAVAAAAFHGALQALAGRLAIPNGFSCIREADIPRLAALALAEANPLYAVPVLYDAARCQAVIRRVALPQ